MKRYTKDEIVERAKEIAKMISETEEVDFSRGLKLKLTKTKRFVK